MGKHITEGYRNQIPKQQPPKLQQTDPSRHHVTNYCRNCRCDVPVAEMKTKRKMCKRCVAERDAKVAIEAERIEREQQAEIEAGRAMFDVQGKFIEFDAGEVEA